MNMFDPNTAFIALHDRFRNGALSREDYDKKLRAILILTGKLPAEPRTVNAGSFREPAEVSGSVSYQWDCNGHLSIVVLTPWNRHGRLNTFQRHVRQAARVDLSDNLTEAEATKLRIARETDDATFEAVMDDLLCSRAEEILQKQGPDAKRAVNTDQRLHLFENPDVIPEEELLDYIDHPGRKALSDMER